MIWRDRPVFITGCTGLVGSHLTAALVEKGARVVGLVRDAVPRTNFTQRGLADQIICVRGDLSDITLLERMLGEYEIDTVFHLAAQAIVPIARRNPLSTFETNIRGAYLLLEACRRSETVKRVVTASSDKAYGESDHLPYVEEDRTAGCYPYDVAKSCADLLARAYFRTYGMKIAVTRCANIFGGGDLQWTRLIPRTIRAALRNEAPTIRSDGTYQRDYLYVANIVDAYLMLAEQLERKEVAGEAFNFGSERPMTVLEMVRLILTKMDRIELIPTILDTAAGEIRNQFLATAKARRILGWEPTISLEDGLTETIAWYQEYLCGTRQLVS